MAAAYAAAMERGERISYRVLERGTPVETSDGQPVGQVKLVMEVRSKDIFDGIIVTTPTGDRFVDAPEVGEIYEQLVILTIDGATAALLPKPGENPGAISVSAQDLAGSSLRGSARRMWRRISGR
jgi:hypothetical protein